MICCRSFFSQEYVAVTPYGFRINSKGVVKKIPVDEAPKSALVTANTTTESSKHVLSFHQNRVPL